MQLEIVVAFVTNAILFLEIESDPLCLNCPLTLNNDKCVLHATGNQCSLPL